MVFVSHPTATASTGAASSRRPCAIPLFFACTGVFLLQVNYLFFPRFPPFIPPSAGTGSLRGHARPAHLAALHVFVSAWRLHAPAYQYVCALDVRRGSRAHLGHRRFYTYYFLCGISAGLITGGKTILDPHPLSATSPAMIPTIGASGAIYGILLAAAMIFPDRQVMLIPFPVTMPMRVYVLIMGAMEFFFTLGSSGDNVSHVCHLGGMFAGYLFLRRGSISTISAIIFPTGSAAGCARNSKCTCGNIATSRLRILTTG